MTVERLDAYRLSPLTDDQVQRIGNGYCPDCSHRGFVLGPRGGNAMNIECGNIECRSRFNIVQGPFSHRALFAHRLPNSKDQDWGTPDAKE